MKHVCGLCSIKIQDFGYPCHRLVNKVSTAFFRGCMVLYDPSIFANHKDICPALEFLENKGILLSTEHSQELIVIGPNLTCAQIDDWRGELCWCYLLDRSSHNDDENDDQNDDQNDRNNDDDDLNLEGAF